MHLSDLGMERTAWGRAGRARHVGRPSVVVAEDDALLRDLMSWELAMMGCLVTELRDGQQLADHFDEALVRNTCRAPDVLVTDLRMPGMGGLEAIAYVRGLGWNGGIIVVTGFDDARTVGNAHRLGAWTVLGKPFDMSHLLGQVQALLPT